MSSEKYTNVDEAGFANRLKELCNGSDSPTEVAQLLGLNVTTVGNYLKGRLPSAEVLVHIRDATGCSIDWLLTGHEPKFALHQGNSPVTYVPLFLEEHVQSKVVELAKRESRSIEDEAAELVSEALVARGEYVDKTDGITLVYFGTASPKLIPIPLLGSIAAGEPIHAVETDETIDVAEDFLTEGQRTFALRVVGDSMVDEHICDGDIIICRESPTAYPGDIVVALIDGDQATVKRFYQRGRQILLRPASPNHKEILLPAERVTIRAIVVGIQRRK